MHSAPPPQSLLQRLYRTKFTLLAVISTVIGATLMFFASWAARLPHWTWVGRYPVNDLGLALLTTGLFGVLYQYVGQQDAQAEALRQLREVLTEAAPNIRDAVVDGFAFAPESLTNMASPETLDRIVENCLGIRLGDPAMAADIYADLREQIGKADSRCFDMQVSASLAPWEAGPPSGRGSMFVATVKWEYRTTPASMLRFACTSDLDEYAELLRDPTMTSVWYFQSIGDLDGASKEVFELAHFAVDGKLAKARRSTRTGTQVYTVALPPKVAVERREVTLSYTYRVLVQRNSHTLFLDLTKPTHNARIQLNYGGCGIRYGYAGEYLTSARQSRVTRLPASGPTPSVEVAIDGWVLPKAGVGFVWVLEDEMAVTKDAKHAKQPAQTRD